MVSGWFVFGSQILFEGKKFQFYSSMPCRVQQLLHGLVTKVREPGLAELPLIADGMVAAELPHGAGLDDMARIEDTSVAKGIDDGCLCCDRSS